MEHPKVILHFDIDHFYSQVEELLNPSLKNFPVGIKQGLNIVTCNYEARKYGVEKWKPITECLKKCPHLKIVPGEDLKNYKEYSNNVTKLLTEIFGNDVIEKLGLDEHYLDISHLIKKRICEGSDDMHFFEGVCTPDEESFKSCECGCEINLKIGSKIANETRKMIIEKIGLTTSVGIAHNKLLAKLAGQMNKPNNTTCIAPLFAKQFMAGLIHLRKITGIGEKTASKLENTLKINTIRELQCCEMTVLQRSFGMDLALRLKRLACGIDESNLKPLEKPKSISFENSFRPISTKSLSIRSDAANKFQSLLSRLLLQIQDDCRIPQTLKITLRKYDSIKKSSIRETRQCIFPTNCFKILNEKLVLIDGAEVKLMKTITTLFDRMVDLSRPFSITLIGLCFCKFEKEPDADEKKSGSMAKFLMKKQDVEVQSITNISNDVFNNDSFRSKNASPSSSVMDFETLSNNSLDISGGSDDDNLEPSPKKKRKKLNIIISKTCIEDNSSPSKLNVSNLRLNASATAMETDLFPQRSISSPLAEMPPPYVDPFVWQEIPAAIKRELIVNWQAQKASSSTNVSNSNLGVASNNISKSSKINSKNTLHKYFLKNS